MKVAIVGASVRAACHSALRAGLSPIGADLFADLDLKRSCPAVAISAEEYPKGLLTFLQRHTGRPWLYTGALENRPGLLRRLAECGPLLGNPASVVRRVRRPETLASVLREADLPCPALGGADENVQWLLKPRRGSAGSGVRPWTTSTVPSRCYLQQRIAGDSHSALYLGDQLIGVTRQLIGQDWLGASGFRYCGNVGPVAVAESTAQILTRLGAVLASVLELRGLFGVDFILCDDVPWPVEVNPRYTASVEVLEHALGVPLLRWHVAAFAQPLAWSALVPRRVVGKGIVYALRDGVFPNDGPWSAALDLPLDALPSFADIPPPGSAVMAGRPVLTLLHQAQSVTQCLDGLHRMASDTYARLDRP